MIFLHSAKPQAWARSLVGFYICITQPISSSRHKRAGPWKSPRKPLLCHFIGNFMLSKSTQFRCYSYVMNISIYLHDNGPHLFWNLVGWLLQYFSVRCHFWSRNPGSNLGRPKAWQNCKLIIHWQDLFLNFGRNEFLLSTNFMVEQPMMKTYTYSNLNVQF